MARSGAVFLLLGLFGFESGWAQAQPRDLRLTRVYLRANQDGYRKFYDWDYQAQVFWPPKDARDEAVPSDLLPAFVDSEEAPEPSLQVYQDQVISKGEPLEDPTRIQVVLQFETPREAPPKAWLGSYPLELSPRHGRVPSRGFEASLKLSPKALPKNERLWLRFLSGPSPHGLKLSEPGSRGP